MPSWRAAQGSRRVVSFGLARIAWRGLSQPANEVEGMIVRL